MTEAAISALQVADASADYPQYVAMPARKGTGRPFSSLSIRTVNSNDLQIWNLASDCIYTSVITLPNEQDTEGK